MFDHFVWSVLVVPMLVTVAGHVLSGRLRPDLGVRVFAWATCGAGMSAAATLLSFAVKAISELSVVARLGGWSRETVIADTAHVPWVSWLSLLWCIAAAVMVTTVVRRRRRALLAVERLNADLPAVGQIVVVHDDSVDAFALPVGAGRVVVTTGMRDALDADQFDAVIAHERCHLTERHHHLLWLTRVGAAIHPAMASMVRRVEYLAERSADEAAAGLLGDRRRVAAALGLAALRARGTRPRLAGAMHIGARPGHVPRRVTALLADAVRLRCLVLVPIVLAASTIVWTGECVYDLQELLRLATPN